MLPRFRPNISPSVFLSESGGSLEALESYVAQITGYREVVWFPYARTAIYTFLKSLNVNGSEVAVSPFNCLALGNAIRKAEFSPYYVDTLGFNVDLKLFREALSRESIACGVYVPLWGVRDDTATFVSEVKPILYDGALESFTNAPYALKKNDAVVLSQGWGKTLGAYQGGFLCGNSQESAERWRNFRETYLRTGSAFKEFIDILKISFGSHPLLFSLSYWLVEKNKVGSALLGNEGQNNLFPLDWNLKRSPRSFASAIRILEQRVKLVEQRKKLQTQYYEKLSKLKAMRFKESAYAQSHFPITVADRDALYQFLIENKIFTSRNLFSSLLSDYSHLQPKTESRTPNARRLTQTTLHLPLYHSLTERQLDIICKTLGTYFKKFPEKNHDYSTKKVFS